MQIMTDEFIDPITIIDSKQANGTIEEGDVIFFNFRTDRGRELTGSLTKWTCMNKTCTN
jgi:2,3-bisphosphoglycerate-independent phosphoglycerate mutase